MTVRVADVEVMKGWFLMLSMDIATGHVKRWERRWDVEEGRTHEELHHDLQHDVTVTFNGCGYDGYMIDAYLSGYTNAELLELSDRIIQSNEPPWKTLKGTGLSMPISKHIDLMPIAPLQAGLKLYAARIEAPKIQDLPFIPGQAVTDELVAATIPYCILDLHDTKLLFEALMKPIVLRRTMTRDYRLDLMSKSDAQIATAVLSSELRERGVEVTRYSLKAKASYDYTAPPPLGGAGPEAYAIVQRCQQVGFPTSDKGSLLVPVEFKERVSIGGADYQMGIGGLHSCEKKRALRVGVDCEQLIDLDVASYYPNLILKNGFAPEHLGDDFLAVYQSIVTRRLEAKARGDKSTADTLKIVINSTFGLFGNRHSIVYDPQLLLQTTITGQLYLLMLIEMIESATFCRVVSANTDGVTVLVPKDHHREELDEIAEFWQDETSMDLEAIEYDAVYSRDVNSYMALKKDGTWKGKGEFLLGSDDDGAWALTKNPKGAICVQALRNYLQHGVPIEDTVRVGRIADFMFVQRVNGAGAMWGGKPAGKTVRFYLSTDGSPITRAANGYLIPDSTGARLANTLPREVPGDLDYDFYINRCHEQLKSMGVQA